MELRMLFNEDEFNYDKYRPHYPKEMFWDIISYAKLHSTDKLIEIGIGTGQATLPFLKMGCEITAVEIGDNLCRFASDKYKTYENLQIVNSDFMLFPTEENSADLIYSATAFHWLPQREAYEKIKRTLKPRGVVALFWNHPFPNRENDPTNIANIKVYNKYRPSPKKLTEFTEADCEKRVSELKEFGFNDVTAKVYRRVRTLSSEDYINLLNTYSDHRALDCDIKAQFEQDMLHEITAVGGKINIYDTVDLYLARKP